MDKRRFLVAATLGAASSVEAAKKPLPAAATRGGPGLLTVAGAIGKSNRGPLDPALDVLLVRHGRSFDKAFVFDAAMLAALPASTIEPTLEYDARPHRLAGPTLASVMAAAGVAAAAPVTLHLRGLSRHRRLQPQNQ